MKPNRILFTLNRSSHRGFTLVELMVAMALIILMLSIMSQAFVIATGTMQGLKEVADMQEKIRPAITLLQRDLGANHFEGSKKLSDPEFWDNGPPKEGYFMLWQDKANDVAEGATNNVTFSQSAALANHMLAFTLKLPGKSPNDFFESSLGGSFGTIFTNANRTGPLFSEFVSPSTKVNTDIIATNVISFDIKLLTDLRYDYEDLTTILSQGSYSSYPPVNNYGSPNPRVFDTWTTDQGSSSNPAVPKYDFGFWNNFTGKWQPSGNTAGNNSLIPVWNATNNTGLNIKAIQISLRIWDQKSNTAKMFVVVQKL